MQFIQAKHFKVAHREAVDWIVIHATQGAERPRQAIASAERFARGYDLVKGQAVEFVASAHYCVGPDCSVQCVRETDVAWHCKGANRRGIGIELCGRADQTPAQWADPYSESELAQAAVLAASMCTRWGIPAVRLSPDDIVRGQRGIAGHMDFTVAFKTPGGHHDPGPDFPWHHYLDLVRAAIDDQDPR
jgi:N-acetyl-anhydromuramyl-L-alanine amidase AmpD